jgi:hypothetical protein
MSRSKLTYLAASTLDDLYGGILENVDRYRSGNFDDLVEKGGWNIALSIEVDLDMFSDLDPSGGSKAEVANSILVWKALHKLTPALACEDRIWTRLSHVECLEYSRKRWLSDKDDELTAKDVKTHFFAPGLTACRDDHSIARLWWNAKIAKDLRPNDQRSALELMLKTADIRSNFVERSWTVSRPKVATAILRLMERESWVTDKEINYRKFMVALNHQGGGVVFELMQDADLDRFMDDCYLAAVGGSS